jgi:hypothetical protein
VVWANLTTTNAVGALFACPQYPRRSVHVTGAYGASAATIQLQGTQSGAVADVLLLQDQEGADIAFSAAQTEAVEIGDQTFDVRPAITAGGDGATDLTVTMLCTAP